MCCSDDPAGDLETYQRMAEEMEAFELREHQQWEGPNHDHEHNEQMDASASQDDEQESDERAEGGDQVEETDADEGEVDVAEQELKRQEENRKLMRMSLNTALAIGMYVWLYRSGAVRSRRLYQHHSHFESILRAVTTFPRVWPLLWRPWPTLRWAQFLQSQFAIVSRQSGSLIAIICCLCN